MGLWRTAAEFALSTKQALWVVTRSRLRDGPGRPSWTFRDELVVHLCRTRFQRVSEQAILGQRLMFESEMAFMSSVGSPPIRRIRERIANVPCEWFLTPSGTPPSADAPVLVYFHGGGYALGSSSTHADLTARLAHRCACRVLSVNYRLAPESPFPAAIEDATAVVLALQAQRIETIALAGDSAGGGLSVATLLSLRDRGHPLPRGAVLLCPWLDLAGSHQSLSTYADVDVLNPESVARWSTAYLGQTDPTTPLASPLYADLAGLPPLLVQGGEIEGFIDEIRAFVEKAKSAGVEVTFQEEPDMIHVWHMGAAILPRAHQAIERVGQFVGSLFSD